MSFGSTGGGFNFGSTDTSGGFSFGSTNTGSGFTFGSNTGQQTGGFTFGSTTTPSTSFSFGSQSTSQQTGFSFGSTSSFSGDFGQSWQPAQNTLANAVQTMYHYYDPQKPTCKFTYFFYNVCEPGKVQITLQALRNAYKNLISDSRWAEAMQRNPDPNRLVPVPARSFTDLKLRVDEQKKRVRSFQATLKVLEEKISQHQTNHEVKTLKKIESIKEKQMKLSHRMLQVQKKLEVLMQRGVGIGSEDIALRNKLISLQRELHKPNQYRGRLNELIPQLNFYLQNPHIYTIPDTIDEEALKNIQQLLSLQAQGLEQLTKTVKKDLKDMQYITNALSRKSTKPQQKTKSNYSQFSFY